MDARRIGQLENRDTLEAKLNSLRAGDTITAHVRRFMPGDEPRYETFKVPYEKWMRVLDVLIYISEELELLIAAKLGEPSHDPHGTPIPGPDLLPPSAERKPR